jgi:hypothetical protein
LQSKQISEALEKGENARYDLIPARLCQNGRIVR